MDRIPMKRVEPTAADKALRDDIMASIKRHLTLDTPQRCSWLLRPKS